MRITSPRGTVPVIKDGVVQLPAPRPIFLLPLVYTTITHGLYLSELEGLALIIPIKGVFISRCILVGVERVTEGELITTVFNLGSKELRLAKGECVSELVLVKDRDRFVSGPGRVG